jgi:predicted nucleic acid-binding protein
MNEKSTIIADSSPLISLALINRLQLLTQLYSNVIIPSAVWDEITVKGRGLAGAYEVGLIKWAEIRNAEMSVLQPLTILLDRGESEVIALALTIPDAVALLDDSRARRIAERLNIKRIGTLGLLRRGKKSGLIDKIRPYIEVLQANHIYISYELIEAVLEDVGEKD